VRDKGEAHGRKRREAGVPVIATPYNGMIHDFVL
jgi:acetyl esterase/lipase